MRTLFAISLFSLTLGGCVVVPAAPHGAYVGPPARVYGPPVVVRPYYGYGPYYRRHHYWD